LIDDSSTDGTADLARQIQLSGLTILSGAPLPAGWSGKLWALEQGRRAVRSQYTMLMDADIELAPGLVATLRAHARSAGIPFVSLMAVPPQASFWEKLLMPAFVYFFKLLYPFRLANSPRSRMAAAAGGCVFLETRLLEEIGGFAAIREALIDDCSLAARVKRAGHPIWMGLTHSAHSVRPYKSLGEIWNMVARTAFVQLRFSLGWLLLCTFLLALSYLVPVLGIALPVAEARLLAAAAWLTLSITYLPTLRFYRRAWLWAPALPLIGFLYLLMTWTSALRYWRGERSRWKGRIYGVE
jgi:hopene-associated glycosyltransferase HpnB